jgi:hypothetical protein
MVCFKEAVGSSTLLDKPVKGLPSAVGTRSTDAANRPVKRTNPLHTGVYHVA